MCLLCSWHASDFLTFFFVDKTCLVNLITAIVSIYNLKTVNPQHQQPTSIFTTTTLPHINSLSLSLDISLAGSKFSTKIQFNNTNQPLTSKAEATQKLLAPLTLRLIPKPDPLGRTTSTRERRKRNIMGILHDDVVLISPPEKEADPTVITVNCPDKTGLACDLCRIILFFGLSIVRGGNLLHTPILLKIKFLSLFFIFCSNLRYGYVSLLNLRDGFFKIEIENSCFGLLFVFI